MTTTYLLEVETNIKSIVDGTITDSDSYDQWTYDFEDTLIRLTPKDATLVYDGYTIGIKPSLLKYNVEFYIFGDEEAIQKLQQDKEMQGRCVKKIHEIVKAYNEALTKEYIAKIPNAYVIWKNDKFYAEIEYGQSSLDIEFNTVQLDEYFDEYNIEWEYLL